MENTEKTLATELLHELKVSARRWFIAFCVMVGLELATIAGFMWYISLPAEDTVVTQQSDGDANTVIGIGDNYGNETDSETNQESSEKTEQQ